MKTNKQTIIEWRIESLQVSFGSKPIIKDRTRYLDLNWEWHKVD